ncbi:MAG: TM0106 family RecB-like putative nuclease [Planctomycetes bacterium]|nr:TM0106 family RecB-like putative nuclease [Planctomycetota bacterium]
MSRPGPKPITGTHLYTLPRCARAVALEFWGDASRRRPLRDDEEFLLARGRAHEANHVATLGWPEPSWPRGDFAAGAAATRDLLVQGAPGVSQGVLVGRDGDGDLEFVGIPDLLRRCDGASALGDHHYVVGDVKSSSRPRGDQILQLSLYALLLELVQGRYPDHGFLVMKDGREQRIDLPAFRPALDDALARVRTLRADRDAARPFFAAACESCRWSELCLPALERDDDLSLVDGMTEGLRTMLEIAGVKTAKGLARATVARLARDTHVESALLRRLIDSARARVASAPQPIERAASADEASGVLLHVLLDGFADRALCFAARWNEGGEPRFVAVCPRSRDEEARAFEALIAQIPADRRLLHHGRALRAWLVRAYADGASHDGIEDRLLDVDRRLRSCANWPAPITGLPALVRAGLGRDPHRAGRSEAVAGWVEHADVEARLVRKARADLDDLHALVERWLCGSGIGSGVTSDAGGVATTEGGIAHAAGEPA